jgi:hypothetical protein
MGFWEIEVNGNFTSDGKKWGIGTISLDSQDDKFSGDGLVSVATLLTTNN